MTFCCDEPPDDELALYQAELARLRAAAGRLRATLRDTEVQLGQSRSDADAQRVRADHWEQAHRRLSGRRSVRAALSLVELAKPLVTATRDSTGQAKQEPAAASGEAPRDPPRSPDLRSRLARGLDAVSVGVVGAAQVAETLRLAGWEAAASGPDAQRDVMVFADSSRLPDRLPASAVTVGLVIDSWAGAPQLDDFDVLFVGLEHRETLERASTKHLDDLGELSALPDALGRALGRWAKATHVAVCVATPSRDVAKAWGDTFFGKGVQRALERRGHPTRVHLRDEQQPHHLRRADVVLHVLGLSTPLPQPEALNVLWIISHPELATPERCVGFDLLAVASERFAEQLAAEANVPVIVLPQATDPQVFARDPSGPPHEVLFVGNSRGTRRTVVDDLTPTRHDLAVYGQGWEEDLVDPRHVRGGLVPNRELHRYYSSAAIVLNDHWARMAQLGFVSNRVYDALAAGAFVISDHVDGLAEQFDGGVVTYQGRADLADKVEHYLATPGERRAIAERGRAAVLERHTFAHRIDSLLANIALLPAVEDQRGRSES